MNPEETPGGFNQYDASGTRIVVFFGNEGTYDVTINVNGLEGQSIQEQAGQGQEGAHQGFTGGVGRGGPSNHQYGWMEGLRHFPFQHQPYLPMITERDNGDPSSSGGTQESGTQTNAPSGPSISSFRSGSNGAGETRTLVGESVEAGGSSATLETSQPTQESNVKSGNRGSGVPRSNFNVLPGGDAEDWGDDDDFLLSM